MHLGSTGQLLYTEIIQFQMPLEQVGMSMKPINFLWHIQTTIYLRCGPTRNAAFSGLNPSTALERVSASYLGVHPVAEIPTCSEGNGLSTYVLYQREQCP